MKQINKNKKKTAENINNNCNNNKYDLKKVLFIVNADQSMQIKITLLQLAAVDNIFFFYFPSASLCQ